jgi:NDP-sugar pyrophosphorylase family protein
MNTVLLSAGYSERLRPLTDNIPKCLLPATSKGNLLQYWVDLLIDVGIEKIWIVTCWKKEEIRRFVNRQCLYTRNMVRLYEEEALEPSGQALYNLSRYLGDRCLIVNTDTFITKTGVVDLLKTDSKVFPIHLGVSFEEDVREGSLVSVWEGVVVSFTEKPKEKTAGYSYAGILTIDNKVTNIKSESYGNITPDIVEKYVGNMSICDVGEIVDIGRRVEGYYEAIEKIRRME